jgi:hypothetical protein
MSIMSTCSSAARKRLYIGAQPVTFRSQMPTMVMVLTTAEPAQDPIPLPTWSFHPSALGLYATPLWIFKKKVYCTAASSALFPACQWQYHRLSRHEVLPVKCFVEKREETAASGWLWCRRGAAASDAEGCTLGAAGFLLGESPVHRSADAITACSGTQSQLRQARLLNSVTRHSWPRAGAAWNAASPTQTC